jgi:hypothetical protein
MNKQVSSGSDQKQGKKRKFMVKNHKGCGAVLNKRRKKTTYK